MRCSFFRNAANAATIASPPPLRGVYFSSRRRRGRLTSELLRLERVAVLQPARLQPGHEPARALRRRAVGKGIGHHITLALSLQPVVADRRGGLHRRLYVARLDKIPGVLCVVRPQPGEAVGLQFDPHLHAVGVAAVEALLQLLHLRQDAGTSFPGSRNFAVFRQVVPQSKL